MSIINPPGAPDGSAESSSEEYTKGLPKRGAWKIGLIVLLCIVLIGFFFLPDGGQDKLKPSIGPVNRPQADLSDAIAKELKNKASTTPAPVASAPVALAAPKFSPPVPSPLGAQGSGQKEVVLSAAELRKMRLEKAAASPMEAAEVDLSNNRDKSAQQSSQQRAALQASSLSEQADAETTKALNRLNDANRQPVAAPVSARKPNGDELFLNQYTDAKFGEPTIAQAPVSQLALAPGTIIRLALLQGINTDSPGQITARVVSNVYDSKSGRVLLIPMGSRVIGIYNSDFAVGQRRVVMATTRIDFPNGVRVNLAGSTAADIEGYSGLEADVNNHYFSMFGSSLLVGAASLLLPKDQQSVTTTSTTSGSQTSGGIFGRAVNDVAEILAQRNKITRPTGTIEPGTVFTFSTVKEIVLDAYK